MDIDEPISEKVTDAPKCRPDFSEEEFRDFVQTIVNTMNDLEDLSNLGDFYRAAKNLSAIYFDCPEQRVKLAQLLNECEFPKFATKIMKRLNNMGVFSCDYTWFSTFHMYNIVWNNCEIYPAFSTALALAGLPHLLNSNLGHPPYIENLYSKNVAFLIRASLGILYNICRQPGNRDLVYTTKGRDALLSLFQNVEDGCLKSLTAICLAHVLEEAELQLACPKSERIALFNYLFNKVLEAGSCAHKREQGFTVLEYLGSLFMLTVHDCVKTGITELKSRCGEFLDHIDEKPPLGELIRYIIQLIRALKYCSSSADTEKEAYEAIRILANLVIHPLTRDKEEVQEAVRLLSESKLDPVVMSRTDKAFKRFVDLVTWQASQPAPANPFISYEFPHSTCCGPVVFSYAPINRDTVVYFMDHAVQSGLHVWNDTSRNIDISHVSAQRMGLSGLACTTRDHETWLNVLRKATVMIVCLTDAYRINPGCRAEIEFFLSTNSRITPKQLVYIKLPPKFKASGWVTRLPGYEKALDFTHRRTFAVNFQYLLSLGGKPYGIGLDEELLPPVSNCIQDPEKFITDKDLAFLHSLNICTPADVQTQTYFQSTEEDQKEKAQNGTDANRILAAEMFRPIVDPSVIKWTLEETSEWFNSKGLKEMADRWPEPLDGILLHHLIELKLWAPDYFARSLQTHLGLTFHEGLRLIAALDQLLIKPSPPS